MATVSSSQVETCIVSLGNSMFLVRKRIEYLLTNTKSTLDVKPAVVMKTWDLPDQISVANIQENLKNFDEVDDVYSPEFAVQGVLVLVHSSPEIPVLDDKVSAYIESSFEGQLIYQQTDTKEDWNEGPYFLRGDHLHQAWRLYADELDAFVSATIPAETDSHSSNPLCVSSADGRFAAVAVPSRLYFPVSDQKPLNGMRVAVKDNYHISGTVTTLGSRSYANCYGIQKVTSTYVQELIDLGAIVVGKTKLCSFAGSRMPPAGTIDYVAPFNPRGDGYQSASGSSMGSGAAVAGYSWLDFALGTDTTGSIRALAAANGVWGLRTTLDPSLMINIVTSVQSFDVLGLLSRSADTLLKILPHASGKSVCPTTLIYPTDWLPAENEVQQKIYERFALGIEDLLSIKRSEVSLTKEWSKTAPEEFRGIPLPDYLRSTGWMVNMWWGYHNFHDYRELRQKKFGKPPYLSPEQKWKWYDGSHVTLEQRTAAENVAKVFKAWISEYTIKEDSSTIMIIPSGSSEPDYRDEGYPNPTKGSKPGGSYNGNFFATIQGLPHLVIPVGQLPYDSKITDRSEHLPVTIGLVGSAHSDETLIRVAKGAVQKMGLPSVVQSGSLAFPIAGSKDGNASMPNLGASL